MTIIECYNDNNLAVLKEMETNSIDAVVGDPPYQVNLNPNTCGWDTWPPLECWQELARVVKPDGLMAFSIAPRIAHERVPDVLQAGWRVLEVGFWIWGSGRPVRQDRLKRCYDLIYFVGLESKSLFTNQARCHYKANSITGRTGSITALRGIGRQYHEAKRQFEYVCGERDYFPADVACEIGSEAFGASGYELIFAVKRLLSIGRTSTTHPTEKPNDLVAQMVKLVSRPDDKILDPWMGSGTTGVACIALQRNFIGIEAEQEYFEMAERKLNGVQISMLLESPHVAT